MDIMVEKNTLSNETLLRSGKFRSSNGAPESEPIYHYGIKTYQEGSFTWGIVKVLTDDGWVHGNVKIWDGSSWKCAK